jgi:uncharacterized protein YjiK
VVNKNKVIFTRLNLIVLFLLLTIPVVISAPWPGDSGTEIQQNLPGLYEPSGIIWHPYYKTLFLVSDNGILSKMDVDGSSVSSWNISGDLEGVTITDSNSEYVYILVEYPYKIIKFNPTTGQIIRTISLTSIIPATQNSNLAIEGIAYVPNGYHPYTNVSTGGLFYLGLQENGKIYVVNADFQSGTSVLIDSFTPSPSRTDISDLYFSTETKTLYILYDGTNILKEVATNKTNIIEYNLPLTSDNQEGITLLPACPSTKTTIFIAEDSGKVKKYNNYPVICPNNCKENITTYYTNWSSCAINDAKTRTKYFIDLNYQTCCVVTSLDYNCHINNGSYINTTETQNCNYCSPNLVNASWNTWQNQTECRINNTILQSRTKIEYDSNKATCYDITKLASDLWTNKTYTEYQEIICDYCIPNLKNITSSYWDNISTCYLNNTISQQRNLTQYDSNFCNEVENKTFFEYKLSFCDYCVPNLINTTWSNWENIGCNGNQMNQQRTLVQYDSNFCNEVENKTFYETKSVEPLLGNTSWSSWYNITECQTGDYYTQKRNITQFDIYFCKNNETFFEYKNQTCDYCVPNMVNSTKIEWINQGVCLQNNTQIQNRSWIMYDFNFCNELNNITYWETQIISCDYCVPNLVNSSWGPWHNITSCQANSTLLQGRSLMQYDNNSCNEISNKTFFDYKEIRCNIFICGDKVCNGNETCSTCSLDCGSCRNSKGSSGGGGGSSSRENKTIKVSPIKPITPIKLSLNATKETVNKSIQKNTTTNNENSKPKEKAPSPLITGAAIGLPYTVDSPLSFIIKIIKALTLNLSLI